MDRLIKRWDVTVDDDLMLCEHRGVAYQRNMARGRIDYGAEYFEAFKAYAGSSVEKALNDGRCAMVERHATGRLLDIGVGSGAFLRAAVARGIEAKGYDINPVAVEWLRAESLYADDVREADTVTLWDALEHIEAPESVLKRVKRGATVFVAIPIFTDLKRIRESKHYKPGEHLYYFTAEGFVHWMGLYGFRLLEISAHEVQAGRESIGAFAFRKDLPDEHDHVEAYSQMHSSRFYGSSATELHLGSAAKVVKKLNPTSILDYGCGRSDLVAHFWRDGERRLGRYDPAIPALKRMPVGRFDLAFCCDVLEHIPMAAVDQVLSEIKEKTPKAFFTISTKLARAKLPDGRNAHVTLLTKGEWKRWVGSYFDITMLHSDLEHELILAPRVA